MRIRLTLILLIITTPTLFAQNWNQALSKEGITVWTRDVSGSDYKEFKSEVIINGTLNNIISIFEDLSTYPKWIHNCIEAEQIQKKGPLHGIRYTAIKSPWPITDRDVVFEYTVLQSKSSKIISIKLNSIKGLVPDRGRVRITQMISNYTLTPLTKNLTKITYQSHNNPAGNIPPSLANKSFTENPYHTLFKLRQLIASGNYKKQIFKEITEY